MNNFLYKFIAKRSQTKDKDAFIKLYQDNQIIFLMMEYCETINPESFYSKIISVDTATEFFSYASVGIKDDTKYKVDLNRMKIILEDSF